MVATCPLRASPTGSSTVGGRSRPARWDDARAAFEDALAEQESAEAHDGLGQALWFLGRVEEGVAARERAFDRLRTRPAL